jgi:hypothetical protein
MVWEGRAVKPSAQPTLVRTQHLPLPAETPRDRGILPGRRVLCHLVSSSVSTRRCAAVVTDIWRTESGPSKRFTEPLAPPVVTVRPPLFICPQAANRRRELVPRAAGPGVRHICSLHRRSGRRLSSGRPARPSTGCLPVATTSSGSPAPLNMPFVASLARRAFPQGSRAGRRALWSACPCEYLLKAGGGPRPSIRVCRRRSTAGVPCGPSWKCSPKCGAQPDQAGADTADSPGAWSPSLAWAWVRAERPWAGAGMVPAAPMTAEIIRRLKRSPPGWTHGG